MTIKRLFITTTGAGTWTVPSDWNSANNSVECIGGGGSGGIAINTFYARASGGGAGAYAKSSNISLTPGASVQYSVGIGGAAVSRSSSGATSGNAGADTWFGASTFASALVGAKAGNGGSAVTSSGGTAASATGGLASASIGSVKYNGGSSGSVTGLNSASGGGGSAGLNGAGGSSSAVSAGNSVSGGGAGDNGSGGAGGSTNGAAGSNGTEYSTSPAYGSGGGGAGAISTSSASATGGAGGSYGAGGGGGGATSSSTVTSGAGAQGIIVITYTPLISGSNAVTEAGDSTSQAGYMLFSGSEAVSETKDAQSSTALESMKASAPIVETADVFAASGLGETVSMVSIESSDSYASSTVETFVSTAAIMETADAASGSGELTVVVTAADQESSDSGASTGILTISGSTAMTETSDAKSKQWWRDGAVLTADFAKGLYRLDSSLVALSSIESTSRASTQYIQDNSLAYQTFSNDTLARVDGIGAYIGGPTTNLIFPSQVFNTTAWSKTSGMTIVTGIAAPDRTTTASKLVEGTFTNTLAQIANTSAVISNSTKYVFGAFAKAGERNWFTLGLNNTVKTNGRVWYNLSTGSVGTIQSGVTTAGMIPFNDGWYYCYMVFTSSSTAAGTRTFYVAYTNADNSISYTGDGVSGGYLWGVQIEVALDSRPTPYVATTSAAAASSGSVVTAVASGGDPFAGYSTAGLGSGMSILVEMRLTHVGDAATRPIVEISDGTTSNRIRFYVDTDDKPAVAVVSGGTTIATAKISTALTVGSYSLAVNVDPANGLFIVRGDTGANATATLTSIPTMSSMRYGSSNGNNYLNDYIISLQVTTPLSQTEATAWAQGTYSPSDVYVEYIGVESISESPDYEGGVAYLSLIGLTVITETVDAMIHTNLLRYSEDLGNWTLG